MQIAAKQKGDKKGGSESTWSKIKFDRQIVAIAKVNGADTLYSTDADVQRFGLAVGLKVKNVYDLPAPRPEQLSFESPEPEATQPEDGVEKDSEQPKPDGQVEAKPEPSQLPGSGNGSAQGPAAAEETESKAKEGDQEGQARQPAKG